MPPLSIVFNMHLILEEKNTLNINLRKETIVLAITICDFTWHLITGRGTELKVE